MMILRIRTLLSYVQNSTLHRITYIPTSIHTYVYINKFTEGESVSYSVVRADPIEERSNTYYYI